MSRIVTLSIDHGYGLIKTSHCSFSAGIVSYDHEPHAPQQVLQLGGRFYVCGSGRQALKRDKTADADYGSSRWLPSLRSSGYAGCRGTKRSYSPWASR